MLSDTYHVQKARVYTNTSEDSLVRQPQNEEHGDADVRGDDIPPLNWTVDETTVALTKEQSIKDPKRDGRLPPARRTR
jgi:hypothetical protein